jgi:paraquat-inducible protein B
MSSRPAIVGAFILGSLALGVAGILFFGGTRLFATTSRLVVFFSESLAGLDVGSPVTFHGVRIGSVQNMGIVFSADTMTAQIPVVLEIERNKVDWEGKTLSGSEAEAEQFVRAGLRAQLALQSVVTGQLRVDLDFRPGTPARLVGTAAGGVPEIPAVPSELGQLRNQLAELRLRDLTDTAQQALAALGRLSDHLDATIDPLAKSAQRAADAATQTLQTTDAAVRQLQSDASSGLRDLDSLIVDAHRQLGARGGELSRTLTAAERTVRQAQTLLDSLNGLAEPRSQFRSDLEAALRDLAASASSLRNFADAVERNPNALLMGRSSR